MNSNSNCIDLHQQSTPQRLVTSILVVLILSLINNILDHHLHNHQQVIAFRPTITTKSTRRKTNIMMSGTTTTSKAIKNNYKNIVIIGGGIQGTSVAYHIAERLSLDAKFNTNKNSKENEQNENDNKTTITILESIQICSAASGKGGGFMARSWGDNSVTEQLHHVSYDRYNTLAPYLNCTSYRTLPVLSIEPTGGTSTKSSSTNNIILEKARQQYTTKIIPSWLDGQSISKVSVLGYGDDTAQITPCEFVTKMLHHYSDTINIVIGTCVGIESEPYNSNDNDNKNSNNSNQQQQQVVTGVRYTTTNDNNDKEEDNNTSKILPADCIVVCAGPWSCCAEDWFPYSSSSSSSLLKLPMEGIKSTSIVWKSPSSCNNDKNDNIVVADGTALFCGEDSRYGTHLEVYPRPDGTIYICGIGGSDYIKTDQLKKSAFLTDCTANPVRVTAAMKSFQQMSSVYNSDTNTNNNNNVVVELDKSQACMRPCPPDGIPYMGQIPNYNGAYINAGHNCWGIAWAPGCGIAMSELILDGHSTTIDLTPFDPTRFSSNLSNQRGRKKQGTNVGEQW